MYLCRKYNKELFLSLLLSFFVFIYVHTSYDDSIQINYKWNYEYIKPNSKQNQSTGICRDKTNEERWETEANRVKKGYKGKLKLKNPMR